MKSKVQCSCLFPHHHAKYQPLSHWQMHHLPLPQLPSPPLLHILLLLLPRLVSLITRCWNWGWSSHRWLSSWWCVVFLMIFDLIGSSGLGVAASCTNDHSESPLQLLGGFVVLSVASNQLVTKSHSKFCCFSAQPTFSKISTWYLWAIATKCWSLGKFVVNWKSRTGNGFLWPAGLRQHYSWLSAFRSMCCLLDLSAWL